MKLFTVISTSKGRIFSFLKFENTKIYSRNRKNLNNDQKSTRIEKFARKSKKRKLSLPGRVSEKITDN